MRTLLLIGILEVIAFAYAGSAAEPVVRVVSTEEAHARVRSLIARDNAEADEQLRQEVASWVARREPWVVEVLVELLEKRSQRARRAEEAASFEGVDQLAAKALGKLGLADAPVRSNPDAYSDVEVEKWREWGQQRRARQAAGR